MLAGVPARRMSDYGSTGREERVGHPSAAAARTHSAPLTSDTHHLFDETQLRRMKPTAILINTARGPIVDDRALHRALGEGWIAGAGLDDIEEERAKIRDWRPDNPLFSLVITPHAAYHSEEAIGTVPQFAAEEGVCVLTGQAPLSLVDAGDLVETRWSRSR
jgi:D-3-phosphoglycerate dehydrogenase